MKKELVDQMSLQEAADYAVLNMVEQGAQCLDDFGGCVYGNDKGHHCAAGWLLDEDDPKLMEAGCAIDNLGFYRGSEAGLPALIRDNIPFFLKLQDFHDFPTKIQRVRALDRLRISHSLDISAPQYQAWIDLGTEGAED